MVNIVRPSQLSFSTVCDFYEVGETCQILLLEAVSKVVHDKRRLLSVSVCAQACHDARSHTKKMALLKQFREKCIKRNSDELFEIYRLLLPQVHSVAGSGTQKIDCKMTTTYLVCLLTCVVCSMTTKEATLP